MRVCYLCKTRIAVVYCFPMVGDFVGSAHRFVASYVSNPPNYDHDTVIVCNGGTANSSTHALFAPIPNCKFVTHDNSGYDIGAFQAVARKLTTDLVVFFGSSSFLPKAGWLKRMVEASDSRGPGLFGTMHNTGDPNCKVEPHIRSTGFWLSTKLFNQYPYQITEPSHRYPFEHGEICITSWVIKSGLHAWVANWEHEFPETQWGSIPNSFHRGDQSGLLVRDRLTEPPYYPAS